jgi:hypothetical protein
VDSDCLIFQECGKKHSPARCEVFKKMTSQQRLKKIYERELCRLSYCHVQERDCWSQGRVPNCGVDGCEAPHYPLLHGAIVAGRVMVVQGSSRRRRRLICACREDVRVGVAGKTSFLHTLYDWGASVTLVTHVTAEEVWLERVRQPSVAVVRLSGRCTVVGFHYMVQIVDGDDRVLVIKAMGVDSITTLGATDVPADIEERFPQARGWGSKLVWPAKDVEMLIGMDNQGWIPKHIISSQVKGDNLRLMQSVLGPACILMGNTKVMDLGDWHSLEWGRPDGRSIRAGGDRARGAVSGENPAGQEMTGAASHEVCADHADRDARPIGWGAGGCGLQGPWMQQPERPDRAVLIAGS